MYDEIDWNIGISRIIKTILYKLSDYVDKKTTTVNDAHVFVLLISWVVKILWEKKCIQWKIKQSKEIDFWLSFLVEDKHTSFFSLWWFHSPL